MSTEKKYISFFNIIINGIVFGFLVGLSIAYHLMKITYLEMSYNVGLFIIFGLIFGVIIALVNWLNRQKSLRYLRFLVGSVQILGILSFFIFIVRVLLSLKAAWIVVPILVREGFNIDGIDLSLIRLFIGIILLIGTLKISISIYRILFKLVSKEAIEDSKHYRPRFE